MPTRKADLLLHPVRMRIVSRLVDRPMTALELSDALPDVGQATIYRHLKALAKTDLISVVEERQAHSNIEKVYGVGLTSAHLTADDVRGFSKAEHMQMFTVFFVMLMTQWEDYLEATPELDLERDQAGYTQVPLWLTDEEFAELTAELNVAVLKVVHNKPGGGRTRRLLSRIIMPSPSPRATQEDDSDGNERP